MFSLSSISSAQSFSLIKVDDYLINVGYSIDIEGNYAFIADNDGISIFDISDPTNVVYEQNIPLPTGAFGVHINDGIVYAAGKTSGFYIINVTDILDPEIIGHHAGSAVRVFVQDDLAFVSDYFNGLTIYDVSNKSNPVDESFYFMSGNIWGTVAKGEVAYIANPALGIEVLNVTDPTTPVRIAILSSAVGATHLSIHENKLYVGKNGNGLNIFDVSTPSSPVLLGSYYDNDGGEELGLRGNDTYLAVADNFGIELFNITSLPTVTKLAEYRNNVAAAHDVEMIGNYIYAVDGNRGFFVLEISMQPTEPTTSETSGITLLISFFTITTCVNAYDLYKKRRGKGKYILLPKLVNILFEIDYK